MKEAIKLNNEIEIDLPKLIESRLLVQANSGGGKSWANRRIIEQAFGKVQIIVIDPEGEFGNMRAKYDFVYAGKGGDAPVESRSAALLARRLLELKASAIIDLYELTPQERKHFVRLFLDAMVNAPKELWHDCLVILDEAHKFAPEKEQSEASEAVIDMASRGRKRGYCLIPATQRPAKLNKDVAAECNNKLIGRASLDIDRKRSADELGFSTREEIISLRNLEPGEFYVFGPAISRDVVKTTIGDVEIKPPSRGQLRRETPPPTDKVRAILSKLADLPQEAAQEATTSAELKAENTQLKRELAQAKRDHPQPAQVKIQKIEVPSIGKRSIERIEKFEKVMRKMLKDARMTFAASKANVQRFEADLDKLLAEVHKVTSPAPSAKPKELFDEARKLGMRFSVQTAEHISVRGITPASEDLSGPEQRILDAIAWMESIGISEPAKEATAFMAGYSPSSSGFTNACGSLRTKGFVIYPAPGAIALTDDGRNKAIAPDHPPTREELHRKVLEKLPGPERRLLQPIIEVFPADLSNEELAEKSGYSLVSSGFTNARGKLRTLGFIDYPQPGRVVAKKLLFP
ncbi:MAG: ATP-binding protein [Candidatus Binatia bacterium]